MRLHHALVFIHPFPNGNGRHSRLMGDLMALRLERPTFSWGQGNLVDENEARTTYIAALRAADNHDFDALNAFARS